MPKKTKQETPVEELPEKKAMEPSGPATTFTLEMDITTATTAQLAFVFNLLRVVIPDNIFNSVPDTLKPLFKAN